MQSAWGQHVVLRGVSKGLGEMPEMESASRGIVAVSMVRSPHGPARAAVVQGGRRSRSGEHMRGVFGFVDLVTCPGGEEFSPGGRLGFPSRGGCFQVFSSWVQPWRSRARLLVDFPSPRAFFQKQLPRTRVDIAHHTPLLPPSSMFYLFFLGGGGHARQAEKVCRSVDQAKRTYPCSP